MPKKEVGEVESTFGETGEFDEEWNTAKTQRKGRWNEIFERLKEEGGEVKLSGLTEGQIGALYRKTKQYGWLIRTIEHRTAVIIRTVEVEPES